MQDTSTSENSVVGWVIVAAVIFVVLGGIGGVAHHAEGDPAPSAKAKPAATSSGDGQSVLLQGGWPTGYPQFGVVVAYNDGVHDHTLHQPFHPGHVQTNLRNKSVPWVGAVAHARWNVWSLKLDKVPPGTKVSVGVFAHGDLVGCAITTSDQSSVVEQSLDAKTCTLVIK